MHPQPDQLRGRLDGVASREQHALRDDKSYRVIEIWHRKEQRNIALKSRSSIRDLLIDLMRKIAIPILSPKVQLRIPKKIMNIAKKV